MVIDVSAYPDACGFLQFLSPDLEPKCLNRKSLKLLGEHSFLPYTKAHKHTHKYTHKHTHTHTRTHSHIRSRIHSPPSWP